MTSPVVQTEPIVFDNLIVEPFICIPVRIVRAAKHARRLNSPLVRSIWACNVIKLIAEIPDSVSDQCPAEDSAICAGLRNDRPRWCRKDSMRAPMVGHIDAPDEVFFSVMVFRLRSKSE